MNIEISEIYQVIGEKQLQLEGLARANAQLNNELKRAIGDLKRLAEKKITIDQLEVNGATWKVKEAKKAK